MLILSTISEASFNHIQGKTSRDLWISLEHAYEPSTNSREYTLKTQLLLRIEMKGNETLLNCLRHATKYRYAPANIGESMKDKDLVMLTIVERQFNTKLKNVQTDPGGELRSLTPFFTKHGIIHRCFCPHTSEQNGIVKRHHHHVLEASLALLAQSYLPQHFW